MLYQGLEDEEEKLSRSLLKTDQNDFRENGIFATLYQSSVPGEKTVRLVGPVGERPVHVCLLRAGTLDTDMREGLIDGVK